MKIKTKSGFVCEIDENRADDWDFCDYLLIDLIVVLTYLFDL